MKKLSTRGIWLLILLTILAVGVVAYPLLSSGTDGGSSIFGETGKEYNCAVGVELDVLSKSDITSASCTYNGDTCRFGSVFSIFDIGSSEATIKVSDGTTSYTKNIEQFIIGEESYEMNNLCFPSDTDSLTVSLVDDEGAIQDSKVVTV